MTKSEILAKIINENNFKIFIEVGVWKGDNLQFIADNCPNCVIIGVDLYSTKTYTIDKISGMSQLTQDEFDKIYQGVLARFIDYRNVYLFRRGSVEFATCSDVPIDIVFIDGAHDFMSVYNDIQAWLPKIKQGGILCGHDYCDAHIGVKNAVDSILPTAEKDLQNKLWFFKKL